MNKHKNCAPDQIRCRGTQENNSSNEFFEFFSINNINCLCLSMLQNRSYTKLDDFLKKIPNLFQIKTLEVYLARIYVAYRNGDLNEVFNLIKSKNYPEHYWEELQEIWFSARCTEYLQLKKKKWEKFEARKLKRSYQKFDSNGSIIKVRKCREISYTDKLEAVDRYRIKRKHPFPLTIWDGDKVKYKMKESSRLILKEYLALTKNPGCIIKKQISAETGLTIKQITNWFKNRRQREDKDDASRNARMERKSTNGAENSLPNLQNLLQ